MKFYKQVLQEVAKNEATANKELQKIYVSALNAIRDEIYRIDDTTKLHELKRRFADIADELNILKEGANTIITDNLNQTYNDKYYGTIYQAQMELNTDFRFNYVDRKQLEAAVKYNINGLNFTDRLYNKRELEKIQSAIVTNLVQGKGTIAIAKDIKEVLNVSYRSAMRIARTERGRVSSIATLDSINELTNTGIDVNKQWLATLDNRTRDRHADLDGQVVAEGDTFKIDGFEAPAPGLFGEASMDIDCRCDVITVIEGISPGVRLDNISKDIIDYMDYTDWYSTHVD